MNNRWEKFASSWDGSPCPWMPQHVLRKLKTNYKEFVFRRAAEVLSTHHDPVSPKLSANATVWAQIEVMEIATSALYTLLVERVKQRTLSRRDAYAIADMSAAKFALLMPTCFWHYMQMPRACLTAKHVLSHEC